jgi:hypothetical protein
LVWCVKLSWVGGGRFCGWFLGVGSGGGLFLGFWGWVGGRGGEGFAKGVEMRCW